MSPTPARPGLDQAILKQLAHPLKLRLALCAALLTAWYGLFFSPMSERVAATTTRVAAERQRIATAREVERLKKSLAPYRDLAGSGDVHDLIRHVMQPIRSSALRLVDLKPEKPKDLGPFESIGLRLNIEGTYADVDQFLAWTEAQKRAIRIGAIRLTPDTREAGRLSAQITLVALAEKATAPAAKGKAEATRKKP